MIKNGRLSNTKYVLNGHEPFRLVMCAQVMQVVSDSKEFRCIVKDGSGSMMCLWHLKEGEQNVL